jgi:hypothetical protein
MNLASRIELVKGNIFKDYGTTIGFPRYKLIDYICATGLTRKSSTIQKVISSMKKNDHLVMKDSGLYYIKYRRKDKASPKGIAKLGYDIQHNLAANECMPGVLYPLLMSALISDFPLIRRGLEEKGSCIIKFATV